MLREFVTLVKLFCGSQNKSDLVYSVKTNQFISFISTIRRPIREVCFPHHAIK